MQKKIPLRKCLGCNEQKPKKELIRIVKNNQGEISVDFMGKKPGRGAYICNIPKCLEQAIKTKRIERAFECKIDPDLFQKLMEEITQNNE